MFDELLLHSAFLFLFLGISKLCFLLPALGHPDTETQRRSSRSCRWGTVWDVLQNGNQKLYFVPHGFTLTQQINVLLLYLSGQVFSVDWSPDGEKVASGGKDRVLKLWMS